MAKTQLNYYGPAPVNAKGVLAAFVKQPVNDTPSENANGTINYTEKWKGPYGAAMNILTYVKVGDPLITLHSYLRLLSGNDSIVRYGTPSCPARGDGTYRWVITSINVEELQAGDHCIITVNNSPELESEDGNELTLDETQTQWNISWQSYTVTPYEFMSGELHQPIPVSPSGILPAPDWSLPASRSMINNFINYNGKLISGQDADGEAGMAYVYTPDPKTPECRYALSKAEEVVMEKINLNRNAIWHYPIVTLRTVKIGGIGAEYDEELGEQLDRETDLPDDCPYTFAKVKEGNQEKALRWIKIGDDMSHSRTKTQEVYERREMWAGYTDIDENYYGNENFSHTENGIKNGRWHKNCL